MAQLEFDASIVEALEAVYGTRDVLRRRRLVRDALAAQPGERVLDVGCGPGFYVSELLEQVGPEGAVVAVDGSPDMLAVAQHRCAGGGDATFHEADATSLPVEDGSFDAALSVQVLEYVADVDAALREIHRALRPGGRALIWDVDWATVSMHSDDRERLARVLAAWDEHLAHPSLPRTLAARLRGAGFEDVRAEAHAFTTTEPIPDAYGGSLIPIVVHYVGTDDARAWAEEQLALGERGEFYFSVTQLCFTARRAG